MGPRSSICSLVLVVLLSIATRLSAQPQRVGPVEVEMVAEQASIQPGQPLRVGLHIVPDHHWHVYWQNPGDAGLPPTLKWSLPALRSGGKLILVGYFGHSMPICLAIFVLPR